MLTAGITLMKLGVIPLYNPRNPSFSIIVLNTPVMVTVDGSIAGWITTNERILL